MARGRPRIFSRWTKTTGSRTIARIRLLWSGPRQQPSPTRFLNNMDNITRQIADFASAISFDRLPDDVIIAATQYLVDSLACAIAARDCEPALMGFVWLTAQCPTVIRAAFSCMVKGPPPNQRHSSILR